MWFVLAIYTPAHSWAIATESRCKSDHFLKLVPSHVKENLKGTLSLQYTRYPFPVVPVYRKGYHLWWLISLNTQNQEADVVSLPMSGAEGEGVINHSPTTF